MSPTIRRWPTSQLGDLPRLTLFGVQFETFLDSDFLHKTHAAEQRIDPFKLCLTARI